jgi:aminocarboxymuconate-semialdehyde decarboxylase
MIIDVHGHLVPPDLLAAIRRDSGRFASLRPVEDGGGLAIAFAAQAVAADHERAQRCRGAPAWMAKRGN